MAVPTGSNLLQSNSPFETLLSAAMIVAALAFMVFMRVETGTGRLQSHDVTVEMINAGTLKPGTDVRLAGVKIGTVMNLSLDRAHYYAVLRIILASLPVFETLAGPRPSGVDFDQYPA